MYLDTSQLTAGISVGLTTKTVSLKCFKDDIKIYRKVKCELRKKSAKELREGTSPSFLPSPLLSLPLLPFRRLQRKLI